MSLLHQRDQALVAADPLVRDRAEAVHLELLDPRLLHVRTKVLVEVGVRVAGRGGQRGREAVLEVLVPAGVLLVVVVAEAFEVVGQLQRSPRSEVVQEGLTERLVLGVVMEEPLQFLVVARGRLAGIDTRRDVLGLDGLVLLYVALRLAVEAVQRAVGGVGVDDDGREGDLDALVRVVHVLHALIDALLPGVDGRADARLVVGIVGQRLVLALGELAVVVRDDALVGHLHVLRHGFVPGGLQLLLKVHELRVRVTEE